MAAFISLTLLAGLLVALFADTKADFMKDVCGGAKATGPVSGRSVQMRSIEVTGVVLAPPLPTVDYDADCAAKKVTKCSLLGKRAMTLSAVVELKGAAKVVSSQFFLTGEDSKAYKCAMTCHEAQYATIDCAYV